MSRLVRLLVVIALASPCFADNLTYVRIDQPIVQSHLKLTPVDQAARLQMLRNQFLKAGCTADQIVEQPVPGQEQPNIICTIPGTKPGSIVIAARSDYQSKGAEAAVDWATLSTLPLLAESLYGAAHRYSLVFIAFTGHKDLAGSATYLKQLSDEQRKSIRAMIDLEQIGRTPPTYSFATLEAMPGLAPMGMAKTITHADTAMTRLLPMAAHTLKYSDMPGPNREQLVTDAQNFERAGTLALTVTSPAYATFIRPGNTEIQMARTELDPKIYYQTYNLLCVYTLYLDRGIAPPRTKPATVVAESKPPSQPASAPSSVPIAEKPESATGPTAAPAVSAAPSVTAVQAPVAPDPPATAANTATPPTQEAPAESANVSSTPTFRSTTRLVQVDVVVTDKAGRPITGLKQSDFTVFQDGKPQPVRAFEAHMLNAETRKTQPASKLPANTYSNLPDSAQDQSWTIVLYDMLNTPIIDQQVARQQLVKLLKSLPSGTPVALFTLGQQRLELVHGFTSVPAEIATAAEQIKPQVSEMLTTNAEQKGSLASMTAITANASAYGSPAPVGLMNQSFKDTEALRTNTRTLFTLDALEAMGRSVSGYPGRKNLLWLSGSFPIRVEADQGPDSANIGSQFRNVRDYHQKIAKTDALLTESRVAVYPVDVRGLITEAPDSVTLNERESLTQIAHETGGRAFVGTNDFGAAMKKAMDDGSTYYTIAYTPPEKKEKSEPYQNIEVKLDRSDVNLSYRRGYYSTPQETTVAQGAAALQGALQPGMPPATMLYVMASVQPPNAKQKAVGITYIVSPNNVTFTDASDHKKHVLIDCMAIAYDKDGREVAHASDTLDGAIPTTAYETIMKNGLPAHQEISLKPGTYNLRLGVMDRTTQQIGTVDVPLEITQQMAAK